MENPLLQAEIDKINTIALEAESVIADTDPLVHELRLIHAHVGQIENRYAEKANTAVLATNRTLSHLDKTIQEHVQATKAIKDAIQDISIGNDVLGGLEKVTAGIRQSVESLIKMQQDEAILNSEHIHKMILDAKENALKTEERILNAIVTLENNTTVEIPNQINLPVVPKGTKKVSEALAVQLVDSMGNTYTAGGGGGVSVSGGGSSTPSKSHSDVVMLDEANNTTYIQRTENDGMGGITPSILTADASAAYVPTTPGSLPKPTKIVKSGNAVIGSPLNTQTWDSNSVVGNIQSIAVTVLSCINDPIANSSTVQIIDTAGLFSWILPVNSTMYWDVAQERDQKLDRLQVVTNNGNDRVLIVYSYTT